MLKRVNEILNLLMGSISGVFIGHGIYVYWDYKTNPGLYAMGSAPWYAGILLYGIFTVAVLAAAIAVKAIIRKKMKQRTL